MAAIVVGCSSSGGDTTTTTTGNAPATNDVPTDYEGFRAQTTACGDARPEPVTEMTFDEPADERVEGSTTVVIETSCGPIVITVDPSVAPETVNSFVFLAEQGYFDGSVSHRVLPGFMVQAGDPSGTGRGGPGYTIADEFPSSDFLYDRGVVAMANAGPDTTGSQFFIMFAPADWMPPNYSVFGVVTSGFETLDAIEALPLAMHPSGRDPSPSVPLETLYIKSVTVER